jgi:hypothetical protein
MRWLLTAQCKCFAHGILFAVQPAARNSIADKCFLVGGQITIMRFNLPAARPAKQGKISGHFAEKYVARSISGREGFICNLMRFAH